MVLKFVVSKQEKVKDYPWVSTQGNSGSGQINGAVINNYSWAYSHFTREF